VQPGDTLSGIAAVLGLTVEELMAANGLLQADQLAVGQELQLPIPEARVGPEALLLPDSELVYGPGYRGFDVAGEVRRHPGWLKGHVELVGGAPVSGPELVERVALQYSVGPRVLLALLEMKGGALTQPHPPADVDGYLLGYARGGWEGFSAQLALAANALNEGFYGWLEGDLWTFRLGDGSYAQFAPAINAGTAGLQRALVADVDHEGWCASMEEFDRTYRRLWGDPFHRSVELLPPDGTVPQPQLSLPWALGETWYFTGGPHGGWDSGSAWAAVDFATDERNLGCYPSERWVTASAPGRVLVGEDGMVLQELDEDGFVGSGWVLLYMHLAADGRVAAGSQVGVGDPLGHPSCEGGVSNASHLHFARRYNGMWMAADDDRWPLVLDGWRAEAGAGAYDGTFTRGTEVRTAAEQWAPLNAMER
jgi:LysM repeat protein